MHATARETRQLENYFIKKRWHLEPEDIDSIDALIHVSAYQGENQCNFLAAQHDFCLLIKTGYEALGYEVHISEPREECNDYLVEIQW